MKITLGRNISFFLITKVEYYLNLCIIYIHFNTGNIQSDLFFKFYIRVWEKAMAPHFTTLAWKIPWTEEPGRLQSVWLLTVGHS